MDNQNWKYQPLKKVIKRLGGGTPSRKNPQYFSGDIPWITVADIPNDASNIFFVESAREFITDEAIKKSAAKLIPTGSVVLATRVSVGKVGITTRDICTNQDFTSFLPSSSVNAEFLAHYLRHKSQELLSSARGATIKGITTKVVDEIPFPVISTDEQRSIVGRIKECLSRVDEIKQLREESQKEASHILESGIEDLFKNIPGDDKTIGDVVSIDSVLIDPREDEYLDLLHVGGANIVSGTGEIKDLKTAREENLISGKFVFTPGHVVYSKIRPYLRKVIRPDFRGICSADIYPLNPKTERITADYLFYLLLSRDFTNYANVVSNRAGMPKVNRTQLFAYEFKLPDLETQNEITAKLDEMRNTSLNLADEFRNSTEEINTITDSILRKAFAGEL